MKSTRHLAWLLPCTAAVAAGFQDPAAKGTASTTPPAAAAPRPPATLHQAWLTEIMDLDRPRAADLYREVAKDKSPDNLERWVAIARLAELHRLGVTTAPTVEEAEVPAAIRAPLAAANDPVPTAALTEAATQEPAQLLQSLGTTPGRLPLLRPAVYAAEAWLIGQIGPNWRDRSRLRPQNQAGRAPFPDRYNAVRILVYELEGRRNEAESVRALYFTQWRPPATANDAAKNLARAKANIETLVRERQMQGSQLTLLLRLGEALDKTAATDPGAAQALLLRLPFFAELLLPENPPERR